MKFTGIDKIRFINLCKNLRLDIWNISFDGNYSYTDIELMNFLNKYNIENGIKKSKINCYEIEYLLRTNYDDYSYKRKF